jgi:hypothetical protein
MNGQGYSAGIFIGDYRLLVGLFRFLFSRMGIVLLLVFNFFTF